MRTRLAALALLVAGAALPAGAAGAPSPGDVATGTIAPTAAAETASVVPAGGGAASVGGGSSPALGRRGVARPGRAVPAQTVEGLTQDVTTSYRVDAEAVLTRVTVSATLTNTSPDRVVGDYIEYYFFDAYTIPLPAEATNVSARTGGGGGLPVSVEPDPEFEWVSFATAPLDPELRYGQTRTVELTYDLATQPFRSVDTLSQANEAFYMFALLPLGDPGAATVDVRVPDTYEVEVVGDALDRTGGDGQVVLEATRIADPLDFWALVLASDESRLSSRTVDVEGATVHVHGWPGDDEWSRFVVDNVEGGAAALSELTGQPWPEDDLTVIETMAPVAQGYGGWYEAEEHTIRIGNELDPQLMVHELAHVWINFDVFEERWLVEGFAEVYAYEALLEMGREPAADRPGQVPGQGRVALNRWVSPIFVDEEATLSETYGYDASWYVVGSVADEIGMDAMQRIVTAAVDGTITYPGDGEPEDLAVPMDWRRALDLFENVGGSEGSADLFRQHVVTEDQRSDLDERAGARESYEDLAERGGGWSPPLEVRAAMSEWQFGEAEESMGAAGEVLDVRDEIRGELEGLEVGDLALGREYETAGDLAELQEVAADTLAAAEAYAEAEARSGAGSGPLGTIGLLGSGTGGRLDEARLALEDGDLDRSLAASETVTGRLDRATRDGLLRLAGAALLIGVAGAATVAARRRPAREL